MGKCKQNKYFKLDICTKENFFRRFIGFFGIFLTMLLTMIMNIVGMSVSPPVVILYFKKVELCMLKVVLLFKYYTKLIRFR